jgi:hypothetical protein
LLTALNLTNLKVYMTTVEKQILLRDKILAGLDKVYDRLLEFKKQKNTDLVVIKDNKIVKIKP